MSNDVDVDIPEAEYWDSLSIKDEDREYIMEAWLQECSMAELRYDQCV